MNRAATEQMRDVNFGDPVTPYPTLIDLPALPGSDPISILGYPVATGIADKLSLDPPRELL